MQCSIVATRMHRECVIALDGEHLMQRFAEIIFRPRLRRMCIDDTYSRIHVCACACATTRSTYAVLRDRAEAPTSIALWQL